MNGEVGPMEWLEWLLAMSDEDRRHLGEVVDRVMSTIVVEARSANEALAMAAMMSVVAARSVFMTAGETMATFIIHDMNSRATTLDIKVIPFNTDTEKH